jgi:hypothetical protein
VISTIKPRDQERWERVVERAPAGTLVKLIMQFVAILLRVRPNAFPFAPRDRKRKKNSKRMIETPPMGSVYSRPVCKRGKISSKVCIDRGCIDCSVSASFLLGSESFELAFAFSFLALEFVLLGQSYGILTLCDARGCLFFFVHLINASLHVGS